MSLAGPHVRPTSSAASCSPLVFQAFLHTMSALGWQFWDYLEWPERRWWGGKIWRLSLFTFVTLGLRFFALQIIFLLWSDFVHSTNRWFHLNVLCMAPERTGSMEPYFWVLGLSFLTLWVSGSPYGKEGLTPVSITELLWPLFLTQLRAVMYTSLCTCLTYCN